MRDGSGPRPGRAALVLITAASLCAASSWAAPPDQAGVGRQPSVAAASGGFSGNLSVDASGPLASHPSGDPVTDADGGAGTGRAATRQSYLAAATRAGATERVAAEVRTTAAKQSPRLTVSSAWRTTTAVSTAAAAVTTTSTTAAVAASVTTTSSTAVATAVAAIGAATAPAPANATAAGGGGAGAAWGPWPGNATGSARLRPARPPTGVSHFLDSPVLYMLLPFILFNKCAFGCKMDGEALQGLRSRPAPIALGLAAQFVVLPLVGYGLSRAFALDEELSLGLVVACSCPGGGGGYLYSLLLGGDVALALAMTLASTLAAVAAMPASTALYSRVLGVHHTLRVPFSRVLATLLFVLVPVSLGAVIKHRRPRLAEVLLDVIRPFTLVVAFGGLYVGAHAAISLLGGAGAPPALYGAAALVPACGLLLGLALARAARLPGPVGRAVTIECGTQNSLLALAVLQLSLPQAQADSTSRAPFLVALSTAVEMWVVLGLNAAYSYLRPTKSDI